MYMAITTTVNIFRGIETDKYTSRQTLHQRFDYFVIAFTKITRTCETSPKVICFGLVNTTINSSLFHHTRIHKNSNNNKGDTTFSQNFINTYSIHRNCI